MYRIVWWVYSIKNCDTWWEFITIIHPPSEVGGDYTGFTLLRVTALLQLIHRWPVNSPHKRPVTRKMIPFDDVIMCSSLYCELLMVTTCSLFFVLWSVLIKIATARHSMTSFDQEIGTEATGVSWHIVIRLRQECKGFKTGRELQISMYPIPCMNWGLSALCVSPICLALTHNWNFKLPLKFQLCVNARQMSLHWKAVNSSQNKTL